MNAEALGGFTDWRVPTKDELLWSATEIEGRPDFVSGVIFDPLFGSGVGDLFKTNQPPVRAVRGGP